MSWIKEDKFSAALGGGTLAGVILLYVVGSQVPAVTTPRKRSSTLPCPKPQVTNRVRFIRNRKTATQSARPSRTTGSRWTPFKGLSKNSARRKSRMFPGQEFTNHLLAANTDIRAAFQEAGVTVPEPFFVGFEKYKNILASGNSTGVLDYQLGTIKDLMLILAKAKPTELKISPWSEQPEESGQTYAAGDSVAREFPLEIAFVGPEKSVRDFLTAITAAERMRTS